MTHREPLSTGTGDTGIDYAKVLSRSIQEIKPSGIRKFFDLLNGMSDVVALTVGEPDFVTPWHIRSAGIESLEKERPTIPPTQVL